MELLNIELVSPSGQLVESKQVLALTVPSVDGEINILPGHADMVCLLGKGLLKLDDNAAYIVYKGFMEISSGTNVVIAAERATSVLELDKQNVLQSIKETEEKLLKEYLDDDKFKEVCELYQDRLAELKAFN